ncbi:universal stress protein [Almyronema epifaneia]|uniref:Universal stress protein n=1 Tax=Almyronema epifaneia S1 TaxID=2991925 RepID=A0ABW6I8Z1_9CYAN
MKRILVALDKSDLSQVALQEAIALAKALEAKLLLLHVLSGNEPGYPETPALPSLPYYSEFDESLWRNYRQTCQEFSNRYREWLSWETEAARSAGVTADYDQISGQPGRTICDFAKNWQADLIVIGSRQRAGLSELLLGSVSNYVMHHAPCSVLIVHPSRQSEFIQTAEPASTAA